MKAARPSAGVATLAAGSIVALAVVVATGLSGLTKPAQSSERLRRVADVTARAERAVKGKGDAGAYPAGAVCRGSVEDAAEAAERRIQAAAASAGVTVSAVTAAPGPREPDAPLAEVRIEVMAEGAYDATLMFLNLLARSQPEVFADTLDLETKGSKVELAFTGRLLCSTSARF